jgi:hypothetical protein
MISAAKRRQHVAAGVSPQNGSHYKSLSREAAAASGNADCCRRFAAQTISWALIPWADAHGYVLSSLRDSGQVQHQNFRFGLRKNSKCPMTRISRERRCCCSAALILGYSWDGEALAF